MNKRLRIILAILCVAFTASATSAPSLDAGFINPPESAKPGVNKLVVKITNLCPNRLIGDEQLPPDCEWNDLKLKVWPQ